MRKRLSAIFMFAFLILIIAGMVANYFNCASEIYFMVAIICVECSIVIFMCKKHLGIILSATLFITIFTIIYVVTGGWKKMLLIGIFICALEVGVYMIIRRIKSKAERKQL